MIARTLALGVLLTAVGPSRALACATCIASAYGDRTYNLAYLILLVMPILVSAAIGGVLAWHAGARPRTILARLGEGVSRLRTASNRRRHAHLAQADSLGLASRAAASHGHASSQACAIDTEETT